MRAKDSSLRCLPWGTGLATVGLGVLAWGLADGHLPRPGDPARLPRRGTVLPADPLGGAVAGRAVSPSERPAANAVEGAAGADAEPALAGSPDPGVGEPVAAGGDRPGADATAAPALPASAPDPFGSAVSLRPASFERAPRGESPAPR